MKRVVIKVVISIFVAFIIFTLFLFYSLSDGFRDYKNYCSKFIPQLENIYKKYHKYPETLEYLTSEKIDFRYDYKKCGYHSDKKSFSFYFSDGGIGVVGYSSKTKKWWFD